MNNLKPSVCSIIGASIFFAFAVAKVCADDIDIYSSAPSGGSGESNIIFVLDNTSNWSRNTSVGDEKEQGAAELAAIVRALSEREGQLNVGLMHYETGGNANDHGGTVRFDLEPYSGAAKAEFDTLVANMTRDIRDPDEKKNSNIPYGDLLRDYYNYAKGFEQSSAGTATVADKADADAYDNPYSDFESPFGSGNICGDTHIVFIANQFGGGVSPDGDTQENSDALNQAYIDAGYASGAPDALAGGAGNAIPLFEVLESSTDSQQIYLGLSASQYRSNQSSQCTRSEEDRTWEVDELSADYASYFESLETGEDLGQLDCGQADCQCSADLPAGIDPSCDSRGRNCNMGVYLSVAGETITEVTDTPDYDAGRDVNIDDWAKFLHSGSVEVPLLDSAGNPEVDENNDPVTQTVGIKVHVIDVYESGKQNFNFSTLLYSTAEVGGGEYYAATTEEQIGSAISEIFTNIVSVDSSFTAVTLPISVSQRTQRENEVYLASFRPTQDMYPRWYGNLKRYQVKLVNGEPELSDVRGETAINPESGAQSECAVSWWTEDSGEYWAGRSVDEGLRSMGSLCPPGSVDTVAAGIVGEWSSFSDYPDGPAVEKGGAAQKLRGVGIGNRVIYAESAAGIALLGTDGTPDLAANIENYLRGTIPGEVDAVYDSDDADGSRETDLRPSIHGDIVHSSPVVINYGTQAGDSEDTVKIFYGANDGLLHAVNGGTGVEDWAFLAESHVDKLDRLYYNDPYIFFEGLPDSAYPENSVRERKDYFFDGPITPYVEYNENDQIETAYLLVSMRRGGRQVYALDVSTPGAAPSLLWKLGCDDTPTCTPGGHFDSIGQTWSAPVVFTVDGYQHDGAAQETPIVAFGGGYDPACLDNETISAYADCRGAANTKGKDVYFVDLASGDFILSVELDSPVVGNVKPLDFDQDTNGHVDYVYAADVAGGLHRLTVSADVDGDLDVVELKLGQLAGSDRRFMSGPFTALYEFNNFVGLALGSGDREQPLESDYPYDTSVQNKFYFFIDRPASGFPDDFTLPVNLDGLVDITDDPPDLAAETVVGWQYPLSSRGEQIVNEAVVFGSNVFFNTFQPGGESDGLCTAPIGIPRAYTINYRTLDVEEEEIVGSGLPIPPLIAPVRIDLRDPMQCEGTGCLEPCEEGDEDCSDVYVVPPLCVGCENYNLVDLSPVTANSRSYIWYIEERDQ